MSFRFTEKLILSLKPGVVYKTVKGKGIILYSAGVGSYYEFPIAESIHIGPMVEVALVQDDVNYLAGFHMGFSF
ncbi:MAG: hypothetical protein PF541_04760 [Prolixibacteraceae bacterium]|nr:hypothetical protein [Prolixibacteraceae bacterium]